MAKKEKKGKTWKGGTVVSPLVGPRLQAGCGTQGCGVHSTNQPFCWMGFKDIRNKKALNDIMNVAKAILQCKHFH